MNLLLIDYITLLGHRNFNMIHVESMLRLGHNITLVGRKEALSYIRESDKISKIILPEWVYGKKHKTHSYFHRRLLDIRTLYWIKRNVQYKPFDKIVFLAYDIMSLSFFRTNKEVILINHANVSELSNRQNFILTKLLPRNYKHVGLNSCMLSRLRELFPTKIVQYVPHGIVPTNNSGKRPSFMKGGEKFLFCPVNSNYDRVFIKRIFESDIMINALQDHDIKLFVKESLGIESSTRCIKNIVSKLSNEEYDYMLKNALAVILPYSNDFKYRCSGIFFECVAYDTPVLTTKMEDMLIYKNDANILFFQDEDELVDNMVKIDKGEKRLIDKSIFSPDKYWQDVLCK